MNWLEEIEQINQKAKGGDMFDIAVANITNRDSLPRLIAIARAAQALADKLEAVHDDPRYQDVWYLYAIHGGHYTEPKYELEFDALREALKEPDTKESAA